MLDQDPGEGLELLVDLARATDPALRARARRLAPALIVPAARQPGPSPTGGCSRIGPVVGLGADLDVDATLEAAEVPGAAHLRAGDLRWRGWRRPGRAVVLLVDASGSVHGPPLVTALVTVAALLSRSDPHDELAVVAFWSRAVVLRDLRDPSPPEAVVERLLRLRGGDTTDLAAGLEAALSQAALAGTGRRDVLALTDGLATEGADPVPVAGSAPGAGVALHVLALAAQVESMAACADLAGAGGGRLLPLHGPWQAPAAVAAALR